VEEEIQGGRQGAWMAGIPGHKEKLIQRFLCPPQSISGSPLPRWREKGGHWSRKDQSGAFLGLEEFSLGILEPSTQGTRVK
jgi:hypothetical protein